MKTLMDEVCFEMGGAVVHMRKKSNAGSAVKSFVTSIQIHVLTNPGKTQARSSGLASACLWR